tara:strand:- start:515 stop:703 length:189 start_codon:yes stop_codon:yes gene_type:complete
MLMGKKTTNIDAFRSKTSGNGQVNDNESIVESIFKLPYRIKERYDDLKKHKNKTNKVIKESL